MTLADRFRAACGRVQAYCDSPHFNNAAVVVLDSIAPRFILYSMAGVGGILSLPPAYTETGLVMGVSAAATVDGGILAGRAVAGAVRNARRRYAALQYLRRRRTRPMAPGFA